MSPTGAYRQMGGSGAANSLILRGSACWELTSRDFGLRDAQWERIKDLLPGREGTFGVTWPQWTTGCSSMRCSIALVQECPWRDLPERLGDWKNVRRRFSRWAEAGVRERVFQHLQLTPTTNMR